MGYSPDTSSKIVVAAGFSEKEQDEFLHNPASIQKQIQKLEKEMKDAAANLEFETAAKLRDKIRALEEYDLSIRG